MSYSKRIKQIEYQITKDLIFEPTDLQRVEMAQSILKATLSQAEENAEDLYSQVQADTMPANLFGVQVTWDKANPEGDSFTLSHGGISVTQDADNPTNKIINTSDGIDDFEAVRLDANSLMPGSNTDGNPNMSQVTNNITFPNSGPNGTTVTWDASAMTSIDNSGIVSQPSDTDESGQVVATITKGSESTTKTFNITVLQSSGGSQPSGTEFITTWQTDATGTVTSGTDQVKLPLNSAGTYSFTVDWGDGTQDTITSFDQAEVTHTYSSVGSYDITIDGVCEGWGFWYNGEDNSKLTGIKQWGNVKLHNNGYQFRDCDNLSIYTATDNLDISNITNMKQMFNSVIIPTGFDISTWDTSNVTVMSSMFFNTTLPAGFDISTWDTSNVTLMFQMFNEATLPTGFDISGWDTSSATDIYSMFKDTTLPAGFDISGWDTSSVTNMDTLFLNTTLPDPFDLSGWCVTNIPTEPSNFGTFNGTTQLQPVWGTCPGENFFEDTIV